MKRKSLKDMENSTTKKQKLYHEYHNISDNKYVMKLILGYLDDYYWIEIYAEAYRKNIPCETIEWFDSLYTFNEKFSKPYIEDMISNIVCHSENVLASSEFGSYFGVNEISRQCYMNILEVFVKKGRSENEMPYKWTISYYDNDYPKAVQLIVESGNIKMAEFLIRKYGKDAISSLTSPIHRPPTNLVYIDYMISLEQVSGMNKWRLIDRICAFIEESAWDGNLGRIKRICRECPTFIKECHEGKVKIFGDILKLSAGKLPDNIIYVSNEIIEYLVKTLHSNNADESDILKLAEYKKLLT